jgi:hypothetical protein
MSDSEVRRVLDIPSMRPNPIDYVRSWANQLSGEARDSDWLRYSYVVPDVLEDVARELGLTRVRGLFGLIGLQGVGKSSALMALQRGMPVALNRDRILFKWRREKDLYASLVNGTHEASEIFMPDYLRSLLNELESHISSLSVADRERFLKFKQLVEETTVHGNLQPESSDVLWAERKIGKAVAQRLRQDTWRETIMHRDVILIDTPDYSKTDKRQMDKDLQEIYWFWNSLPALESLSTIVVAIQKEMFRDNYFLDKMRKFELKPLAPEQMVEVYNRRFETIYPFYEEALLTLAKMSRGVFRRFLRYILLTLDFWEKPNRSPMIDEETVRKAVPLERLVEDMELEFQGLFPKQSELRTLAVRVIMYVQEQGPQLQSHLFRKLGVNQSTMSRLLGKLESSKHIIRTQKGVDKVVSLRGN